MNCSASAMLSIRSSCRMVLIGMDSMHCPADVLYHPDPCRLPPAGGGTRCSRYNSVHGTPAKTSTGGGLVDEYDRVGAERNPPVPAPRAVRRERERLGP